MKIVRDEWIFSEHFHIGHIKKVNVFCTLNILFDGNKQLDVTACVWPINTLTILHNLPPFQYQLPGSSKIEGRVFLKNEVRCFQEFHTECVLIEDNI